MRFFKRRKATKGNETNLAASVNSSLTTTSSQSSSFIIEASRRRRSSVSSIFNPFSKRKQEVKPLAAHNEPDGSVCRRTEPDDVESLEDALVVEEEEPVSPDAPRNDLTSEAARTRWPFGRARRRAGSILSMSSKHDKEAFVVESFRTIARVQEDPAYLHSPVQAPSEHRASPLASPRQRSPSVISSDTPWTRPASPTISVEAFRHAQKLRTKSEASLLSCASSKDDDGQPERPRFDPVRRSSSFALDIETSNDAHLTPPKPAFAFSHSNVVSTAPSNEQSSLQAQLPPLTRSRSSSIELSEEMKMIALFGTSVLGLADESTQTSESSRPPKPAEARPVLSPLQTNVQPPLKSAKPKKQVDIPRLSATTATRWDDEPDSDLASRVSEDDMPLSKLASVKNPSVLSLPLTLRSPVPKSYETRTDSASHLRKMSKRSMSALSLSTFTKNDTLPRPPATVVEQAAPRGSLQASRSSTNLSSSTSSLWTKAGPSPSSSFDSFGSNAKWKHSSPRPASLAPSRDGKAASLNEAVFDRMQARHRSSMRPVGTPTAADEQDDERPLALAAKIHPLSQSWSTPPSTVQVTVPCLSPPVLPYGQLAFPPIGVDPFLYASLPNDRKINLHHRASELMLLMSQAAYSAKAQSDIGTRSAPFAAVNPYASSVLGMPAAPDHPVRRAP